MRLIMEPITKCPKCGDKLYVMEPITYVIRADGTASFHGGGYFGDAIVKCDSCGSLEGTLTLEIDGEGERYIVRPGDWEPE